MMEIIWNSPVHAIKIVSTPLHMIKQGLIEAVIHIPGGRAVVVVAVFVVVVGRASALYERHLVGSPRLKKNL